MSTKRIRVIIVDDHQAVRKGLTALIQGFDDLELAGQAINGAEAVRLCDEVQPDVVLMDLVMPEMDGIEATEIILSRHPEISVLALTSFRDEDLIDAMLNAGAVGYLLKDASLDELVGAIRMAKTGLSL
jgi:NarL family two-component system response regulator LiaR